MIRKAHPEDCIDLAALSLQVWFHTYAGDGLRNQISRYALSMFTEQYFATLVGDNQHEIWVCCIDQHLVGFVCVDLHAIYQDQANGYEVTRLYVSPHFSRRGIGRRLLEQIEREHGSVYWLTTWIHNEQAIAFYRHLGLKVIGELDFDLDGEMHKNHVFCCKAVQ